MAKSPPQDRMKPTAKPKKSTGRKKNVPPTKPRGEQLLDRLDKNPGDVEAWDELATGRRRRGPPKRR
jgi:hypothetical protein